MKIQLPLFRRIFMILKTFATLKTLPLLLASAGIFVATHTSAAITTDVRGNTAYDTAAECDAAVQNGTARFYVPEAKNKPLRQKGEKSVKTSRISDLGDQYRLGACDVGVGKQKGGRVGVDRKLQGKYVPYSPSMPLNTYLDASGNVVRVSMLSCDNRFSAALPRPVSMPPPPPVVVPPPPPVVVAPPPPPPPAPVVVVPEPVAVVPPPPVMQPPPVPPARMKPYIFGVLGAQNDAICHVDGDNATLLVGQIGAGMNFNAMFGAEIYAQAAKSHTYNGATAATSGTSNTSAVGARLTAGTQLTPQTRIFAKVGAAYVKHEFGNASKSEARPTLGVGFTYDLTPALSLRGDADMSFKRNKNQPHPAWSDDKFVGLGLQYKF
jgi:Outer membrane protein beta-barrel domain